MTKLFFYWNGLLVGLLVVYNGKAQNSYQPGYIITLQGDTLAGEVRSKQGAISPLVIEFKNQIQEESRRSPLAILGFARGTEMYESAVVDKEPLQSSQNGPIRKKGNPVLQDTVFMKKLIGGAKNLYAREDESKEIFFYYKEKGQFHLLLFRREQGQSGHATKVFENRTFISQLADYLGSCPDIARLLRHCDYDRRDLLILFENYYRCVDETAFYSARKESLHWHIVPVAGVTHHSHQFLGKGTYLTDVDFNTSVNPTVGIILETKIPKWRHFYWVNEIRFGYWMVSGDDVDSLYPSKIELGAASLHIVPVLEYRLPVGKKVISFDAGLAIRFTLKEQNKRIFIKDPLPLLHPEATDPPVSHGLGLPVGLGFAFPKWYLKCRAEPSILFSKRNGWWYKQEVYYVLMGYRWNKIK